MENFIYNQMKPNEQKLRFQGIAHVFLDSKTFFYMFGYLPDSIFACALILTLNSVDSFITYFSMNLINPS